MVSEDDCVYVKNTSVGIVVLTLYVEDILLARSDLDFNATKRWLSSVFEIRDMGETRYVLGVEIIKDCPRKFLGYARRHILRKSWKTFLDALL